MRLISPYTEGNWYRGSLHIHSKFSVCGWHDLSEVALAYRDYDFIAVTDHDHLTQAREVMPNKVVFSGYEVSGSSHMLLVEPPASAAPGDNHFTPDHYNDLARATLAHGGLAVLNHPTRYTGSSWRLEDILKLDAAVGLEVFSGDGIHVEEDQAFVLWDQALSAGRKLWGFGNDDFHHWGQERRVWNMVQAKSCTPESILKAFRNGAFYVSTGYGFESIHTEGSRVTFTLRSRSPLEDRAYKYLTLFGRDGQVLAEKTGHFREFTYEADGTEGYIRAEVYMTGGYGGFSQPIFVEP